MAPLFKVEQQDFTRGRFIGQQARAAPSKAEPECRRTVLLYQEQPQGQGVLILLTKLTPTEQASCRHLPKGRQQPADKAAAHMLLPAQAASRWAQQPPGQALSRLEPTFSQNSPSQVGK